MNTPIIMNGRPRSVSGAEKMSYAGAVTMALGGTPPKEGRRSGVTVTYANGVGNARGTLAKDESVHLTPGMVFNVMRTGSA